MSWKQPIYWPIHRLKEMARLHPYTKEQTHEILYSAIIQTNQESSPYKIRTLAIPRPPTTNEQEITDFKLHLPNTQTQVDTHFGNHVLLVNIEPHASHFEIPIFSCNVTIKPYSNHPSSLSTISTSHTASEWEHLHPQDPRIQTLAKNIGSGRSFMETARKINHHLTKTVRYGDPIDGLWSDLDALLRPQVDCGGFDSLFVSLCLASGIQARIVSGFFLDGGKNDMHAWAEFQDEKGRWIPVDPSTEQLAKQGRTKKSGRFGYIGSDRLQLSQGCDIPIEWNNTLYSIPLLQHPFILQENNGISVRAKILLQT